MKLPKDIGYKKQNRIKISKNSNFPSVSAFAFLYNNILKNKNESEKIILRS